MKITIEVDEASGSVHTMQSSPDTTTGYPPRSQTPQASTTPDPGGGFSLSEVIAKASALGAINAGAAPDTGSRSSSLSAAPFSGAAPDGAIISVSAGPPPAHVFSSDGGVR